MLSIAAFLKTSLIEWPGKISSVIFVPGCNFRCPFCHNAELISPERVRKILLCDEKEIMADLKKRKDWIDAVVVTGGEPTLQKDLFKFLKNLKQLKLLTMVHTNGTNPKLVSELIKEKLVDYWGMDLKGDLEDYDKFIGGVGDVGGVEKSIEQIINSGVDYEFRTTVVPTLHNKENLIKLAEQLRTTVYGLQSTVDGRQKTVDGPRWFLQQFRPMNCFDTKFLKIKPFSKEEMMTFQKELQKIIPQTLLRGV